MSKRQGMEPRKAVAPCCTRIRDNPTAHDQAATPISTCSPSRRASPSSACSPKRIPASRRFALPHIHVLANQLEEIPPVALHRERVGHVEEHLRARRCRHFDRARDRVLLNLRVPYVAGEVEVLRPREEPLVQVRPRESGTFPVRFVLRSPSGVTRITHDPVAPFPWASRDLSRTPRPALRRFARMSSPIVPEITAFTPIPASALRMRA